MKIETGNLWIEYENYALLVFLVGIGFRLLLAISNCICHISGFHFLCASLIKIWMVLTGCGEENLHILVAKKKLAFINISQPWLQQCLGTNNSV